MAARTNNPTPGDHINDEGEGQGFDPAQDLPIEGGEEEIQEADQGQRIQAIGAAHGRGRPPPPPPITKTKPGISIISGQS